MARLRDVGPVLKSYGVWHFIQRVYRDINQDNVWVWASALAYSWLFAVFPFLIFLLTLVPYLPEHAHRSAVSSVTQFSSAFLGPAANAINENIKSVMGQPRKGLLGLGLFVSLFAASGGMAVTMSALDECYHVKDLGRSYVHKRTIALLMTIAVAAGVMALIVLVPIGTQVDRWLWRQHIINYRMYILFNSSRYALAMLLCLGILGIVYHYGPSIRPRFAPLSPGAVFSLVVWSVMELGFRVYIERLAVYDKTYGTVGGAAVLLLYFYLDALVILIGAVINAAIDEERRKTLPKIP